MSLSMSPARKNPGIAMHDLNNVLHLIGTGVYHASTQLGEEREWAYGFCEMLSRKPWGSEFLFRCRVIIYIIL